MLGREPFRIDILTSISGVAFQDAYPSRTQVETEAGLIDVIGRADLIANKRASGRIKDLLDLDLLGVPSISRGKPRKRRQPTRRRRTRR